MNGTVLVFKPNAVKPDTTHFTREIELAELKAAIGGGLLEVVPGFTSIEIDGCVRRCVAFCDEEGKIDRRPGGPLPRNDMATQLWVLAQLRTLAPLFKDVLVGQIAVVFGDAEFMEAL